MELSPSNSIKALMYNSHILSGDKTTKVSYGPQHLAPTTREIAMLSGALRACLHEGGRPQVGVVACSGLPHLTCKRDPIKMRDYMDGRVTPPKQVTSPSWGPPPPCKQVLKDCLSGFFNRTKGPFKREKMRRVLHRTLPK